MNMLFIGGVIMKCAILILGMLSASCAIIASAFWFSSAIGAVPPPTTGYGGGGGERTHFMIAFNKSMSRNRWAAAFSALSALFAAIDTFIGAISS